MGIMPWYPDDQSIENELGGKWELFFEETRDESGNVGLEWDRDHNDNLPLHLNGVMIVLHNNNSLVSTPSLFRVDINGEPIISSSLLTSTDKDFISRIKINNGLLEMTIIHGGTRVSGFTTISSPAGQVTFMDFIKNFALVANNVYINSKISVYILRGV